MNATTEPVKTMAPGFRWTVAQRLAAVHPDAARERKDAKAGGRLDARKMPNGDPPPVTLWGSEA